jgi:peptidoglycan hydrolase CwlO-like protein
MSKTSENFNKELHITIPTRLWYRLEKFAQEYSLVVSSLVREALYEWVIRRENPLQNIYWEKEGLQKEVSSLHSQLEGLSRENRQLSRKIQELETKLSKEEK